VVVSQAPRAKSRFRVGRFVEPEGGRATFALPNAIHRDRCEEVRVDVEQALAAHFGRRVPLTLVADVVSADDAAAEDEDPSAASMAELRDAPRAAASSPADRVKSAFPGAEEVQP
jgi:hypothetical protein